MLLFLVKNIPVHASDKTGLFDTGGIPVLACSPGDQGICMDGGQVENMSICPNRVFETDVQARKFADFLPVISNGARCGDGAS